MEYNNFLSFWCSILYDEGSENCVLISLQVNNICILIEYSLPELERPLHQVNSVI
jgi:hypothetical protein